MIYLLPHAHNIDYHIQSLQQRLYDKLCNVWGVNTDNYNCFGRAYRNYKDKAYIPEYYDATNNMYVSGKGQNTRGGLFYEDSLAAMSFFDVVDPIKADYGTHTAMVNLYFFVNVSAITPGALTAQQGQRLDEVAITDVINFIQANGNHFEVMAHHTDIDKVLERYSGDIKIRALNDNMQSKLCFRIELKLVYNPLLNKPSNSNIRPLTEMWRSIRLYIKTTPNPAALIPVGYGKFIQQEYAPGATLTPMRIGDGNSYIAGRQVEYPFTYNDTPISVPAYNEVTGVWTRQIVDGNGGFNDGDFVAITFLDTY